MPASDAAPSAAAALTLSSGSWMKGRPAAQRSQDNSQRPGTDQTSDFLSISLSQNAFLPTHFGTSIQINGDRSEMPHDPGNKGICMTASRKTLVYRHTLLLKQPKQHVGAIIEYSTLLVRTRHVTSSAVDRGPRGRAHPTHDGGPQ
jgi:hypothetical protein